MSRDDCAPEASGCQKMRSTRLMTAPCMAACLARKKSQEAAVRIVAEGGPRYGASPRGTICVKEPAVMVEHLPQEKWIEHPVQVWSSCRRSAEGTCPVPSLLSGRALKGSLGHWINNQLKPPWGSRQAHCAPVCSDVETEKQLRSDRPWDRASQEVPIECRSQKKREDAFLYTAQIARHTKCGQGLEALRIYWKMREREVTPSSYTLVAVLKACSSLKDLESAKKIHADVVDTGLESDLYVSTMLVDVYAKCGSLADARRVFGKMSCRDVVSWNAMILGHSQMGQGEVALDFYAQMQQQGVAPNDRTFVGALRACTSLAAREEGSEGVETIVEKRCLQQVRAIHARIVESGYETDIFVGTMLVDVYGKCGCLVNAKGVFDKMVVRNVVSWNAMLLGYAQMEQGETALQLYAQMQQEGMSPNDRTFVAALKACSSLTTTEESTTLGGPMVKRRSLERVRAIHASIVDKGCESNVYVGTMLVDAYGKCRNLVDARRVFEKMTHRSVVSWNVMIWSYVHMDAGNEALQLYAQMQHEGVDADDQTFVGVLRACSGLASSEVGRYSNGTCVESPCNEHIRAIHMHVLNSGFEANVSVATVLIDMYAKFGMMSDARSIFEKMSRRNVVSWSAMILGYAQIGEGAEALQLYARMQQEGVVPDDQTYIGAIKACICLASLKEGHKSADRLLVNMPCLEQVRRIHSDLVSSGCSSDVFVGTMLVDAYTKCGSLSEARNVFEKICHPDVALWNAIIVGYAQTEMGEEALQLYAQMQQTGVVPNDRTFVGVLKACGSTAGLEKGKDIHSTILHSGLELDPIVATSLIDMYAKCGSMRDAQQVFDVLPARDMVTWSALIAGYAIHGKSDRVFDLFQRMTEDGLKPDGITMLSVLTVCTHAGLVDEAQMYFSAMVRDYGMAPTTDHYTCMVDLLGRAGQLGKAMALVEGMASSRDIAVWQAVLGACQKWCNVEIGLQAFENIMILDRNDAAAYTLMSNIFESAHMIVGARRIQELKQNSQTWKAPGQSWCSDARGVAHTFFAGDLGHFGISTAHSRLLDICVKIKEEIYV